jgi:hypothetical protein
MEKIMRHNVRFNRKVAKEIGHWNLKKVKKNKTVLLGTNERQSSKKCRQHKYYNKIEYENLRN